MITRRPADERGTTDLGWLDSRHTFSFGNYYDPDQNGFRTLRVINDDWIKPGRGFGTHPHRDMEIITYVLEGALEHKDSTGSGSVIRPGKIQRMSAGTGIAHSEYNASQTEPVHLLQIWIHPERKGIPPGYEEREFDLPPGKLHPIASPNPENGALTLHQDATLYAARLAPGQTIEYPLAPTRAAWLQLAQGHITLNNTPLHPGDGAAIENEPHLTLQAQDPAELLLFDLG